MLPVPRPRPEPWSKYRIRSRHPWSVPFLFAEWTWELLAHILSGSAFLEVLEYLGRLSVLVAVAYYFYEAPERAKQKHYQAWQVINTAQGQGGSGGRIDALQDLNKDRVPLIGLKASGASLVGLQLNRANLMRADLSQTDLRSSSFRQANLDFADLHSANLRGADLSGATLENAVLSDVDLEDGRIPGARLDGADLRRANLRGCDLLNIDWKSVAAIKLANIIHVRNPPPGFLDWAREHGAVEIESESEWLRLTTQP